jgi:CheY-like chemotaxis protein
MNRFELKPTPIPYAAMAVALAGVFVADLATPLGVAVWVIYLVPVGLTLFVWRPAVPFIVAAAATVAIIMGFLLSSGGINPALAEINRSMGVATIWGLALICSQLIKSKLKVRQEEWLQTGQTRLNDKMSGDQQLTQLGENILRYLCEYLDAHAGAIFIEDSGTFRRFAAYALPPESHVPERFTPGEGLIGQAVKDGRPFVVHDVPQGYLSVSSALGKAPPRHLLIAPASADGKINAVLEMGFVHPVYSADEELLQRLSEAIGVAIRSSKYRTQLQELLEETQRQAEELQAQSEELRVNNEELEEQSRALKEAAIRMELQQTELEQTNSQLEEQTQLLEAQKDDLTRAKTAVESQARQLDQASRYKSDFLANMSHELRTPLNSSLILAKLLGDNREGNLTPEQVRFAQTIESAGNDLLALITDILDLSKIEAGRMEVKPDDVRMSSLLENLKRTFQPIAGQKGLQFRTHIASDVPEKIFSDSQRLEQILKNLLSNAMKFTEKGDVSLEISSLPGGRIAFAVQDTGIGISESQHGMIFEAFRQADGTTNRKYGGTGLGLSISRELARLLHGEIRLSSEVGNGSTFVLTIPAIFDPARSPVAKAEPVISQRIVSKDDVALRPTEIPAPAARQKVVQWNPRVPDDRERLNGKSRVILVVEDDEHFVRIIYDLAHELGFQCLIATSGEEGVALAAQHVPSAVVLDVGLPDHSGLTVLDRLKRDARTRHVPVHVVSASDYAETAYSLGAVGYMLKPVKREELVQAFERLETRLTQKMRRILVVEDDAVQLESVQRLLQSKDVETVGARNAAECLEKLKDSTFDCMVMDLSLPDTSGLSLLETLSQEDRYSFPPVIVYTGRELTADQEQQLRKYSKSIIIKGAKSPERLLDEVSLFLHQVVADLPKEQQAMIQKARSRDAVLEGRRILIVEDDVRNVFALTSILEPRGAKVEIARNGLEALAALDQSLQESSPNVDLVLMDIMMPEMDGLTAMREIRKRPEFKKLPIIALTAKAMKDDQEECLDAGANDYMAKPLDVEKLLSLVRVWMPR